MWHTPNGVPKRRYQRGVLVVGGQSSLTCNLQLRWLGGSVALQMILHARVYFGLAEKIMCNLLRKKAPEHTSYVR